MKKILLLSLLIIFALKVPAQNFQIDTIAVMLLDKMGSVIGEMNSCSFTLNTSNDVTDVDLGLVKYFNQHQVYLVGPDKMLINSTGDNGHKGFWYNGKQLAYYSYTENNFAVIDAPPTIIATIDSVHKTYGIDFPAADFFYPTFTDDLINQSDQIIFAGKSKIGMKDCFHIIARNKAMGIQIWISDDAMFLPVKLAIAYYDMNPNIQYEATFADWKINDQIPKAMFDFTPPAGANELILLKK